MEQTDRQTDKATHWKSAIFDSGTDANETPWSGQWARLDTMPSFVKELHRQQEICPETKRPHFQIHVVCHRQVRRSALSDWIKHTKWIPVKGDIHIANSIKYVKKADTAVPGTHQVVQGEQYLRIHELFQLLARYAEPEYPVRMDVDYDHSINRWKWITRRLIHTDLKWADKLSNPSLRRMWEEWGSLFIWNWEEGGSFIIEDPPQEEVPSDCLLSDV